MPRCVNRLTVVGPPQRIQSFMEDPGWEASLAIRFCELMETCAGRYVCVFQTNGVPLDPLRQVSLSWMGLSLILDYEVEESDLKGLAIAKDGKLHHCEFTY